jgi:hypothetical protein
LGGGNGYQLKNKSAKKVKVSFKWVGINICSDSNWVDFTLAAHQVEEFDNNYCTPYQAVYADSAAPTDPVQTTPKIVSFTITPNNVNVGNSVEFRITLKKPAPSGGTTIGFSSITNSGLTDTIVNMPRYSTINQGQTEIKVTIRTHKSEPPDKPFAKTDIIFTVTNSVSEKSAELIVK